MRSAEQQSSPLSLRGVVLALFCLGVLLATLYIMYVANAQYFSDAFYMVASGNWMLEHRAIPTTNTASPIPMHFVSQNWLFCVFAACCLRVSEAIGLAWHGMALVGVVLSLALVVSCLLVTRSYTGNSAVAQLMSVLFVVVMPSVGMFRPIPLVMVFTTYCLWANRRYIDTGDWKWLAIVPLVCVLHTNIQAATVLSEPLVCLCYGFSQLLFPVYGERNRALVPIVAGCLCFLAAFLSPYGSHAAFYVFSGKEICEYRGFIDEVRGLVEAVRGGSAVSLFKFLFALATVGVCVRTQVGRAASHLPEIVMAVGGLLATLAAVRNIAYALLLAWWLLANTWNDVRDYVLSLTGSTSMQEALVLDATRRKSVFSYLCFVGALGSVCYFALKDIPIVTQMPSFRFDDGILITTHAPFGAADFVLSDYPATHPKVLTYHDAGSYLEYRGCLVNCTSRAEAWEPQISGRQEHFFFDTIDAFQYGDSEAFERLLAATDWDYVLFNADDLTQLDAAYDLLRGRYDLAFVENLSEDGNGDKIVAVYRRA